MIRKELWGLDSKLSCDLSLEDSESSPAVLSSEGKPGASRKLSSVSRVQAGLEGGRWRWLQLWVREGQVWSQAVAWRGLCGYPFQRTMAQFGCRGERSWGTEVSSFGNGGNSVCDQTHGERSAGQERPQIQKGGWQGKVSTALSVVGLDQAGAWAKLAESVVTGWGEG